ncbi:trans-resveratrol di-O-methyltransferase-like [Rhodamnia argentea]|uniref:Trans-resveratrol di-O-methyltransferase-like n=1 Tax=Rhodamnia argentea TaxID=178133 RepID=A0ABM3GRR0_9MYRT|nr:trans-resveratrol di-O-methyltransferase-like [Rhodamnia argentea]
MDRSCKGETNQIEIFRAHAHVWSHTLNFISSMSLKCAIELGVPDALHRHGHPMTLPELAAALSVPASKTAFLGRLVAILVHTGFLSHQKSASGSDRTSEEDEADELGFEYSLTAASLAIVKGQPLDLSPIVLLTLDPIFVDPFHCMSEWLKSDSDTGSPLSSRTPLHMKHGKRMWEIKVQDEKFNRLMNRAMASDGPVMARLIMDKCGGRLFEGLRTVVDVGGGTGGLARELAEAFPEMEWTVLDLPRVVVGLEGTRNLKYVGGDMFEAVPPADAVLLKWVLHDWSDEESIKILKRCKEAITRNSELGKAMIVEAVIGGGPREGETMKLCYDMIMMVGTTGKERNEKEWAKLLREAGFSDYKITPLAGFRSLIEAYP